ncbi:hypothetical protein, partial [Pseudomonas aeruginosa]|uniref:hypothetical protein n=1 Tax=Pseudomonas aeruginosa TaxID=287 RepID=UPI001F042911
QWPDARGTGGRITVESVARCSWNGWPDGRGIRIFGSHFRKIYSFNFNKLLKFTERFWQTSRAFIYLGSHAV